MKRTASTSIAELLESRIAPATLFGVTSARHLVQFESTSPHVIDADVVITGLGDNEIVQGLDTRPSTGELFLFTTALDSGVVSGYIYRLDAATGAATQVGTAPFGTSLSLVASYGFDFAPETDVIRIVSSTDLNFRVNADTGALVSVDTNLEDPTSTNDQITSIAYAQNFPGALGSTLYGIDSESDQLVHIGGINGIPGANGGVIKAVGFLNLPINATGGFEITADGTAFLAGLTGSTNLYSVDLKTGDTVSLGTIGDGTKSLRGFTAAVPIATISADGRSATYVDVDGDLVTVKSSKGQLDSSDLILASAGGPGKGRLVQLNFGDDGNEFAGANLTITAKKAPTGDGLVNVGWINGIGADLGKVIVKGDLSRIMAGDADTATAGLVSLNVKTFGAAETCNIDAGNKLTQVVGNLGSLNVAGDITTSNFNVAGFGTVRIGGSLDQSMLFANGPIGSITIGGDIIGGDDSGRTYAGKIYSHSIAFLKVGGDVVGGSKMYSGSIDLKGAIGKAIIRGDLIGGSNGYSGFISASEVTQSLSVGGSVLGGSGDYTGYLSIGTAKSVSIGGDLIGGSSSNVNFITQTGFVAAKSIERLMIGGSIISGADPSVGSLLSSGGIYLTQSIGVLTIKGSIVGNENVPVTISAKGQENLPAGATEDLAIGKLTVGGSVKHARIFAGYSFFENAENGNACIGTVTVGGDWISSNLVAGITNLGADGVASFDDDRNFGDINDVVINAANDEIIARIASIAIKGSVHGGSDITERFGFVAEQIGKFSASGSTAKLNATEDDFIVLSSSGAAVSLHEV